MSKKLISGTILQISLNGPEFGYVYGVYIDISDRIGRNFDSNLILIFDLVSAEPITETELNALDLNDLLFGPIVMTGMPSTRRWKIRGHQGIDSNWRLPDFKKVQHFPYIVEDESKIGPWYVFNFLERGPNVDYSKVSHLEQSGMQSEEQVEFRIMLELIRIRGGDPKAELELSEPHLNNVYLKAMNVPVYKNIPKRLRGRADI